MLNINEICYRMLSCGTTSLSVKCSDILTTCFLFNVIVFPLGNSFCPIRSSK